MTPCLPFLKFKSLTALVPHTESSDRNSMSQDDGKKVDGGSREGYRERVRSLIEKHRETLDLLQ